ncbi:hypothetical protein HDU98_010685, partial [Podochytrium sp. JEL0797]
MDRVTIETDLLIEFRNKFEQLELQLAMLRPLAAQLFAPVSSSSNFSPKDFQMSRFSPGSFSGSMISSNMSGSIILFKNHVINTSLANVFEDLGERMMSPPRVSNNPPASIKSPTAIIANYFLEESAANLTIRKSKAAPQRAASQK